MSDLHEKIYDLYQDYAEAWHNACIDWEAETRDIDKIVQKTIDLVRTDERERCIEAVKSLDKSDETILATYTRNFNKGVNIGIELAIQVIKRLGETENGN